MRYYKLNIYTNGLETTFNSITEILGILPLDPLKDKSDKNPFGAWAYSVQESDKDPYYDFINSFLDILEPKFEALEAINIKKEDITFWLFYEYEQQCNMDFDPQEMKRLGDSGIALCISCWQKTEEVEIS